MLSVSVNRKHKEVYKRVCDLLPGELAEISESRGSIFPLYSIVLAVDGNRFLNLETLKIYNNTDFNFKVKLLSEHDKVTIAYDPIPF